MLDLKPEGADPSAYPTMSMVVQMTFIHNLLNILMLSAKAETKQQVNKTKQKDGETKRNVKGGGSRGQLGEPERREIVQMLRCGG